VVANGRWLPRAELDARLAALARRYDRAIELQMPPSAQEGIVTE
jgi:hypothetical protein